MSNTYLECENASPVTVEGSKLSFKTFVYIKAGDIDLLAVNNLVTASQDDKGDIIVDTVEVLNARKVADGNEEYVHNFVWSNLEEVKAAITKYLEQQSDK